MQKGMLVIIASLFIVCAGKGQTAREALLWSYFYPLSTAKGAGTSLALSSVDADWSFGMRNPALIATYTRGEFQITPALKWAQATASYLNNTSSVNRYRMNIASLSLVSANNRYFGEDTSVEDRWVRVNVGLGMERLADFNRKFSAQGHNTTYSVVESYRDQAQGIPYSELDPFGAWLFWYTYLLDTVPGDSTRYFSRVAGGNTEQTITMSENGGLANIALIVAGSYGDRLFLGGGIVVPVLNYRHTYTIEESDINEVHADFDYLSFSRQVRSSGVGVGGKFGILYSSVIGLRVGFWMHTPLLLKVKETYGATLTATLDTSGSFEVKPPADGTFEYYFTTPWMVGISLGWKIGSAVSVGVDYAFTDFSSAGFDFRGQATASETALNSEIERRYGPQHRLRAGAQLTIKDILLWAGGGFFTSPFADGTGNQTGAFLSGGIGITEKDFYLGIGGTSIITSETFVPYRGDNVPTADITTAQTSLLLTFGWRFQ